MQKEEGTGTGFFKPEGNMQWKEKETHKKITFIIKSYRSNNI